MKAAYDVNLPIETFFDQIEDAIKFASAWNEPIKPVQVVNTAFNAIADTSIFQEDCKIRKRRLGVDKTWT